MYSGLNATFIALIPKTKDSNSLDKYRPIALCNIIYKIVSKSHFFHVFFISHKWDPIFHLPPFQRNQTRGSSVALSVCNYGGGIRTQHKFGHPIPKPQRHYSPPRSHHLSPQFVDDNMLFGHPSVQEARTLNALLDNFSKAFGALINKVKSRIFFFNTPPTTQREIARILGFSVASLPSKYLGAPLIASALKHSSWTNLLEKLEAKLFLWMHRALNMASRLVLIKAVLQSMPLYLFSIMAAPKWVLKAIKQLQRNFLWGSLGPNRKWALVKWEKACLPKNAGGIGLRDPKHNNMIMGAKIWWKWLSYPNIPWARLWTAKYANNLPLEEHIRMSEISKGSVMWNSAIKHKDLIQKHSFWEVKDGCTARFWMDS
eukprot:PITA_13966